MSNVLTLPTGRGRHRKGDPTPRQRSQQEIIDDLKEQLAKQLRTNAEILSDKVELTTKVNQLEHFKTTLRAANKRIEELENALEIERGETEHYRNLLQRVDPNHTTQTQLRLLTDPALGRPMFNPHDETMGIDVKALREAFLAEPPTAELPLIPPMPINPPTAHLTPVKPIKPVKPVKPDLANTPPMMQGLATVRVLRLGGDSK